MAVITPFFDVVAGVAILAGRSSLLDTGIFKTANTNFTIRHLLALGFIGYGGWNLWKIERAQDKLKKTLGAESFSADWQTNDKFWNMLYEEHEYLFDEDGMVDYPTEQLAAIAKDMGFDAESFEAEGGDIFIKTFIEETVNRMDGTRNSRTWISGYFSSYDAALQDAKKEKATYESYRDVTYADLFVRDKGQIIVDADNYKRRLYTKIIYQRYRHLGDNPDVLYRAEYDRDDDDDEDEDEDYQMDNFGDMEYIILRLLTDEQLEYEYGDYMEEKGIGRKDLPQQLEDDYRTDDEAEYLREKYLDEEYNAESMLVKSDDLMVELMGFDGSYRSDGEVKVGYTTAAELGYEPKQLKPVMWVWDDIEGYGAFMATEDIRFV